jgi:hypothetical protein
MLSNKGLMASTTLRNGPFGIDALFFNGFDGPAIEHFVFEQNHVGFQDLGVFAQLRGVSLIMACSSSMAFFTATLNRFFPHPACSRKWHIWDDIHARLVHQVGFADTDARGSADPIQDNFLVLNIRHTELFSKAAGNQFNNFPAFHIAPADRC